MGLDMYLHAEKYIGGYSFREEGEQRLYHQLVGMLDAEEIVDPDTPSGSIEFCVCYWRKANQIHAWFVDTVQGGKDDCGDYYVAREQLLDLVARCKRIMQSTALVEGKVSAGYTISSTEGRVDHFEDGRIMFDPTLAEALLPSREGFFFGNTDYDQWYWDDLDHTVRRLEMVLEKCDTSWDFKYHSSW